MRPSFSRHLFCGVSMVIACSSVYPSMSFILISTSSIIVVIMEISCLLFPAASSEAQSVASGEPALRFLHWSLCQLECRFISHLHLIQSYLDLMQYLASLRCFVAWNRTCLVLIDHLYQPYRQEQCRCMLLRASEPRFTDFMHLARHNGCYYWNCYTFKHNCILQIAWNFKSKSKYRCYDTS